MSTPPLVAAFYERLWHRREQAALAELLHEDFQFRGSLGSVLQGRAQFWEYSQQVCEALGNYRCDILDCVSEGNEAFARMQFSGTHRAVFRGYPPTGKKVAWTGAAHFRFSNGKIASLWVLGDLKGLEENLKRNVAS